MQTDKNGISHTFVTKPVKETLDRLLALLRDKEVTVFAVVDHAGEAAKAGFSMNETLLVVFGDPHAGTPIMLAQPDSALDLPLKILIAKDRDGRTRISFNSAEYLQARYDLTPEFTKTLSGVGKIVATIASEEPSQQSTSSASLPS